jgi:hypothetical protein
MWYADFLRTGRRVEMFRTMIEAAVHCECGALPIRFGLEHGKAETMSRSRDVDTYALEENFNRMLTEFREAEEALDAAYVDERDDRDRLLTIAERIGVLSDKLRASEAEKTRITNAFAAERNTKARLEALIKSLQDASALLTEKRTGDEYEAGGDE